MAQKLTDVGINGSPSTSSGGPDRLENLCAVLSRWDTEKLANRAMLFLIAYTAMRNVLTAASKPLWYDELCTVAVAGQPSLVGLWRAFHQVQDSNPPFYCLIAYVFRHALANPEIAYRLPSILGFACALWFAFLFVRKHSGSIVALLCASLLVLTPLYRPYAVEARPYGFFIGCIAISLVCYQSAPRVWAILLLALSLAAAEASHYYAIFAFVPFGAAEAVYFVKTGRLRWSVWLSLATGALPLAVMWPLLRQLQRLYGAHFWAQPNLQVAVDSYAQMFKTNAPIAVGVAAAICFAALWNIVKSEDVSTSDYALVAGFIAVPVVAYLGAKLAHGGLTIRYSMPLVLGLVLGAQQMARTFRRKGLLLLALTVCTAIGVQESFFWMGERSQLGRLDSPAPVLERFANSAGRSDLPVVISDGHTYVQFAYYAPPQSASRFVGVVDAPQSVAYAGSDSLDLQMLFLRCCLPLQVLEFDGFAAVHPEFLLYSDGEAWDWWPTRLVRDGYSLQLVVMDGARKMYLVHRSSS
jgi:hypothetical protein